MKPKRLARLIWLGAIIILFGDLAAAPWREAAGMLAAGDIDHVIGLAGLVYTEMRSLIVTVSILAGISVMVDTLDQLRRAGQ